MNHEQQAADRNEWWRTFRDGERVGAALALRNMRDAATWMGYARTAARRGNWCEVGYLWRDALEAYDRAEAIGRDSAP
jgi:hypothetical protein